MPTLGNPQKHFDSDTFIILSLLIYPLKKLEALETPHC